MSETSSDFGWMKIFERELGELADGMPIPTDLNQYCLGERVQQVIGRLRGLKHDVLINIRNYVASARFEAAEKARRILANTKENPPDACLILLRLYWGTCIISEACHQVLISGRSYGVPR